MSRKGDVNDKESKLQKVWVRAGRALSDIYTPPAWVVGAASGVLSYFGYASPILNRPTERILHKSLNRANCDDVSTSVKLSLAHDNHLAVLPGMAGDSDDPMRISAVLGREVIIGYGTWSVSAPQGTVLARIAVGPGSMAYHEPVGGVFTGPLMVRDLAVNILTHTPGASKVMNGHMAWFLAQHTAYWRGTIKYRVVVPKNMFYSGKLMVAFTPHYVVRGMQLPYVNGDGSGVSNVCPNLMGVQLAPYIDQGNLMHALTCVVDLSTCDDCEMEIPFVCPVEWCPTDASIGMLQVTVMQPLLATNTITASSVSVAVMANTSDMEFSTIMPSILGVSTSEGDYSVAQAFEPHQRCAGEVITSLKQLISKPVINTIIPMFRGTGHSPTVVCTIPFWVYNAQNVQMLPYDDAQRATLVNDIVSCFAFARGSTRYIFIPHSHSEKFPDPATGEHWRGNSRNNTVYVDYVPRMLSLQSALQPLFNGNYPGNSRTRYLASTFFPASDFGNPSQATEHAEFEGLVDITIPPNGMLPWYRTGCYCVDPANVVHTNVNGLTWKSATQGVKLPTSVDVQLASAVMTIPNQLGGKLLYCAGDDAQLGFFLGAPPLTMCVFGATAGVDPRVVYPDHPLQATGCFEYHRACAADFTTGTLLGDYSMVPPEYGPMTMQTF